MSSVKEYIKNLNTSLKTGGATEHSYRPALKKLLEDNFEQIVVLNEPKRQKFGAPDFIISQNNVPIGYIETKDINVNLDTVEKTEQIQRYLNGLENLIITNYLDFRWYVKGELRIEVKLARLNNKTIKQVRNKDKELIELLNNFIGQRSNIISTSKELATRMASISRISYHTILNILKEDTEHKSDMYRQYVTIKDTLISDITVEEFADMLAQTISYGLFTARVYQGDSKDFNRMNAAYIIPKSNGFLRDFFNNIIGPSMDENLVWIVEDLVKLLKNTDIQSIIEEFGEGNGKDDPIIHFYETFLQEYKPEERDLRGVYYTPKPAVDYIVRSVDKLLKTTFDLDGLADETQVTIEVGTKKLRIPKVQILDPAVGTGTFLSAVLDEIFLKFENNKGMWSGFVRQQLLPRLNGFELLISPYTIAHMKIGLKLRQTGYKFTDGDRLRIFLTNFLEKPDKETGYPLFSFISNSISGEAEEANNIKKNYPIMVIIGNPPYNSVSANKIPWIDSLMRGYDEINDVKTENYFEVNGKPLGEANPKWLNDDYVKFIRFAQWKIEQTGFGIVAFITPHGFLDNVTFKGMRESLLNTFDDIYVLDLHGNANKGEGSKYNDQNIFDIRQGVAISIFIKTNRRRKTTRVFHSEIWGERQKKYDWLSTNTVESTEWKKIRPKEPLYLFVPEDDIYKDEYEKGTSVTEIFPLYSNGIVTARDKFTITKRRDEILNRVKEFVLLDEEEARLKYNLGKDTRDWKVHLAKQDIELTQADEKYVTKIYYRPFDFRYTYYTGRTRGFICMPRREVMSNMLEDNLALLTTRMTKGEDFKHVMVTNTISEAIGLSSNSSNNAFVFPLYKIENGVKIPNLSDSFIRAIEEKTGLIFSRDSTSDDHFNELDVFYFIVAQLSCKSYQERYREYLKRDFPKIAIPRSKKLFKALAEIGEQLSKAFLMEIKVERNINFPVAGSNIINDIKYKKENQQLWINENQYFEGISPEIWEYKIGGYKVLYKWLKYREKEELQYDDLIHFNKMVNCIQELINLQEKLEQVISQHNGFPFK
jgi:predicted helicase